MRQETEIKDLIIRRVLSYLFDVVWQSHRVTKSNLSYPAEKLVSVLDEVCTAPCGGYNKQEDTNGFMDFTFHHSPSAIGIYNHRQRCKEINGNHEHLSQEAGFHVLGPAVNPSPNLVAGRSGNLQGDITEEAGSSSQILRSPINSLSSSNGVLPEEMQTNHLPL
jgi:hypothetical protein